jgi:AAA domain
MSSDGRRPARPPQALWIELVGTPGAGKTTLAREAVEILGDHGLAAGTIVDRARLHAARTLPGRMLARISPAPFQRPLLWALFYVLAAVDGLRFAREHRVLTGLVVGGQRRRPIPARLRGHIVFWFFQLGGRRRFLERTARAGDVLVLDDGFLHRAVHLHASPPERPEAEQVAAYVDLLPRPDLVIRSVASRETCERRVRERGVWRHSRHLTDAELSSYLANAERAVHLAVERAREHGWDVVEIDDERDVTIVRRDLSDAIQRTLDATAGRAGSPEGVLR